MPDQQSPIVSIQAPPQHPHVMLITLEGPPINALSERDYKALTDIFLQLDKRTDTRCVILTGAGERCFCAGSRIDSNTERTVERSLRISAVIAACFHAILSSKIPLICAVNGAAVGAGLVLAALSDIVVCSNNATFSLPEINVGLMGGPRHARRLLPEKVVRYLALTGRSIDAAYLHSIGSVIHITPPHELMENAFSIADDIVQKSPMAARFMKEAIALGESTSVQDGFRIEQLFNTIATTSPDVAELALARKEKRPPKFNS